MAVPIQCKADISPEKRRWCYFFSLEMTYSGFSIVDGKIVANFAVQKVFGQLPFAVWL